VALRAFQALPDCTVGDGEPRAGDEDQGAHARWFVGVGIVVLEGERDQETGDEQADPDVGDDVAPRMRPPAQHVTCITYCDWTVNPEAALVIS
jgi:hypothetical protein